MARKGKYDEWLTKDGLARIESWARDGLTDKQIAKNMGVSERSFTDWKRMFPAIVATLKKGKAPVDFEVENALLKSALGHTVKVKKPFKIKTVKMLAGKGRIETEEVQYVDEEVYIPPQTTAQIFWLKNRRPDRWRDKIENIAATEVENLTPIADMINDDTDE